mmetsp:Transcript_6216/g.17405  ORF Transcript_6216/g.17405 Transcript_6216/m.17405 type:complete len:98 (-) Transcript_6216:24-317(-)
MPAPMAREEVMTNSEVGGAALPKFTTVLYAGESSGFLSDKTSGTNNLHKGVTATKIPTNTPTTGGEATLLSCPTIGFFDSMLSSFESISFPNNAERP